MTPCQPPAHAVRQRDQCAGCAWANSRQRSGGLAKTGRILFTLPGCKPKVFRGMSTPGGSCTAATIGRIGYITTAVWGVRNASRRGTKSEVAHKCESRLHNPCRLGGPQRFKAENIIESGPQVGGLATPPPVTLSLTSPWALRSPYFWPEKFDCPVLRPVASSGGGKRFPPWSVGVSSSPLSRGWGAGRSFGTRFFFC